MDSGRAGAILSAAVALVSLILAVDGREGSMVVTSFFVLVFGAIASKRCSLKMNRLILIASFVTLVCTVLTTTVLAQSSVEKDSEFEFLWFYLTAVVHAVPLVPLTFSTFVITASVSEASYNWAVVRGLSVVEYLDSDIVDNGYILYGLLTMLIIMAVFGVILSHYMRKNRLIINENGMVVME